MQTKPSKSKSYTSVILESVNECLPNCDRALDLAALGAERPLKLNEKIKLKYHSQLCPFCSCKELRVESAIKAMHEAEALRK